MEKASWPDYIEIIIGLFRDNGELNGNYYKGIYRGYIGIMEKKMETTVVSKRCM